jgi:hypothetical protein
MRKIEERYISLLTDFGFKRIFGTDPNKELLINFLNSLFDGEEVIKDVKYLNSENVGDVYTERKAIFDVYCENENGEILHVLYHFLTIKKRIEEVDKQLLIGVCAEDSLKTEIGQ